MIKDTDKMVTKGVYMSLSAIYTHTKTAKVIALMIQRTLPEFHKQLNLPRMKKFTTKNFSTFDVFVTLPNKKKLWEKWGVFIPTLETKRHYIFYDNKINKIK
jgi:S-ribosylhomocysteine lyase LuxS involved in autoinducer biosynthesis